MPRTPAFDDLLVLLEDRSAALRASVADVPDPRVRVPSCPDWSLRDLVRHLTDVHRFWAAAVAAGPSEKPPALTPLADAESADLVGRSAAATEELIAALRAAGPVSGCWTWWGGSDVPMTSGAVARHQVHEAAVHAFDAQLATGTPRPVPEVVALDGIAAFIDVAHGTAGPWPHRPVRIGLHATEGASWLVDLTASGARGVDGPHEPDADPHGPGERSEPARSWLDRLPVRERAVGGTVELMGNTCESSSSAGVGTSAPSSCPGWCGPAMK